MIGIELERVLPTDIERRSFEIIGEELSALGIHPDPENELVVKRAIHTTADFDYADSLVFTPHAVRRGIEALKHGAVIITDTNMGLAGINKKRLAALGGEARCFMADEDVARRAAAHKATRAAASMEKAADLYGAAGGMEKAADLYGAAGGMEKAADLYGAAAGIAKAAELPGPRPVIFAIGNAPTALIRLCRLIGAGRLAPALVIGAPVGFVNVIQSKELLLSMDATPSIVARGRKGGSNVAAAICNAMLYQIPV